MPIGTSPDMLVVLDDHPSSHAGLTIAQRYARGITALASWETATDHIDAEIRTSVTAEPTIGESLRVAAQRRAPWVAIRRDFAPPRRLLSDLLVAAAQNAQADIPGFAVFLAEGEPAPFRRVLVIHDRRSGPISGLGAYIAVAVADTAGAVLDVLVLGDNGSGAGAVDSADKLAVSREQEYLDKARERARSAGLEVNWSTAEDVEDPWPVVLDQLGQYDYDLVIDDLGDISFRSPGSLRRAVDGEVALGQVGEIPLRLLEEASIPLLLVIDEIRLGMAPKTLLKLGTVAAITLGAVATGSLATGSAAATGHSAEAEAEELALELELALGIEEPPEAASEERAERRAETVAQSSRGGGDGARGTGAESYSASYPTGQDAEAEEAPEKDEKRKAKKDKDTSEEKKEKKPKAPKGGASPSDVKKAQRDAAAEKQELAKLQAKQEKAKKSVAEAEADFGHAQEAAEAALSELNAATLSHGEAEKHAAEVTERASGLTSVLPGSPEEAEVLAAVEMEQSARERLDRAMATGAEALEGLEVAEVELTEAEEALAKRKENAKETKAEYKQAKEKVEVYRASLAETRQSPVDRGYRLTARFGNTGGYWSSGVHTGLDFAAPAGTDIKAAASGTVVSAGWQGAYGNQVVINHGGGVQTSYSHLSRITVSPGQKVRTGDKIGDMGSTGNSTGSHLHFEVEKNGKFTDPEAWLGR